MAKSGTILNNTQEPKNSRKALTKKDGWSKRARHMHVRYRYLQQAMREGDVHVEYVASEEQLADGLTKAVKPDPFAKWRDLIGPSNNAEAEDSEHGETM
jgi:hypothetical protein